MNREGIGVNMNNEDLSNKERMQRIVEKVEYLCKEMEALQQLMQEKNAYIKHLEAMLDERLRVV